MKFAFRRCAALSAVLIIIVICAFAALRVTTPWLTEQRGRIENLVSAVIGGPVSIEGVTVAWQGLMPSLRLRDVQVHNAAGDAVLAFGSVYMKPAAIGSLFDRRLQLSALHIVGADIHVVRARNGEIKVRGLNLRPRTAPRGLRDIALTVRSSRVRWDDHRLNVDYRFRDVDIKLNTRDDRNDMALRLDLPGKLGHRLHLRGDLRGELRDPETWRGRVYLKATEIRVAELPAALRVDRTHGEFSLESWGVWRDGGLAAATGDLDADALSFVGDATPEIDNLRGKFRWQRRGRGWTADVEDLELARAGARLPASAASFDYRPGRAGQASLHGAFEHARLEDIVALLRPDWEKTAARELIARAPRGELQGTRFKVRLKGKHLQGYVVGGAFSNFGIDPATDAPGVTGADGRFRIDRDGGAVALDARAIEVRDPRLFAGSLAIDTLKGPVDWRRENGRLIIESPALTAANEDLRARGSLLVALGGTSPRVNLAVRLADGDLAHLSRYLPVKIIKPKAQEWLEHVLVDGRLTEGRVIVKGDLAEFPFREREGVFEARLRIERGVLDYRPGWPRAEAVDAEVIFRGPSVLARSRQARVLESQVEAATLRIPDLRAGDLRVDARARGPASDILQYLRRAGLIEPDAAEKLALAGETRLDLKLRIPLSEELKQRMEPRAQALVRFSGAALRLVPWNLAFTDADGGLSFGPDGFHADDIQADFRGDKVIADIAPIANKGTEIQVHGRLRAASLLRGLEHSVLRRISGESTWRARVNLPPLRRPDEPVENRPIGLRLTSDLEGISIALPSPVGKPAEGRLPLSLSTVFGGGAAHSIRVRYGQDLSGVAILDKSPNGFRLTRGELRIRRGRAVLPAGAGVFIKADLNVLSVDDWRRQFTGAAGTPAAGFDAGLPLRGVDATIKRLELFGNIIENVRFDAKRGEFRWLGAVDSSQVKGRIAAPLAFGTQVPVVADLEFLQWTTGQDAGSQRTEIDPRSLPPLRVTADALRINELAFTDVQLRAARSSDGLVIEALELTAPDFRGQIRGAWRALEAGEQSSFDIMLKSQDLGSVLRRWNLVHSVRDGAGRLEAHLSWPGNPVRVDLKGLAGRASLRAEDGRLRGLDPGAGRLLGLLNVDVIARRLALDFSDLFRTGFSFDVIKGDFTFKQGAMHTKNLSIDGPSAQIDIGGSTDLVARQYDLRVVVQPELISGLPLAGVILGGPIVGAAVYVAGKIAEEIDSEFDEGTKIPYSVQGPWTHPRIKSLAEPPAAPGAPRNFPYNQR